MTCQVVITRRAAPWQSRPAAALVAATLAVLPAAPAAADRHCAPALDLYYRARHAIRAAPEACPAALARAAGQLAEATVAARNCDCPAMETRLQDLLDSIGADTTDPAQPGEPDGDARSCQARAALVFDAADPLGDAFDACL